MKTKWILKTDFDTGTFGCVRTGPMRTRSTIIFRIEKWHDEEKLIKTSFHLEKLIERLNPQIFYNY